MQFNVKSQSNDELRDAILRQIDEYALAFYISQMKGEIMTPKHGGSFQIGEHKGQGSISTFTNNDGVARASDFAENFTNSNIFDWIEHLEGVKDYREKLIRGAEIAGGVTIGNTWDSSFTDAEKAKRREQLEAEKAARRKDYDKFKAKHVQTLRNGLNSNLFDSVCKKRGFDASKVATLKDIGFAVDGFTIYMDEYHKANDKNKDRIRIRPHSLVVWNDNDASLKALELDAETGKRKSEIQMPGMNCWWMPFDDETVSKANRLYFTEGETSAIALIFAMIDNATACAFPCKANVNTIHRIQEWAKTKEIILAYDNDNGGRKYTKDALAIAPNAIDISELWSGEGWQENADPNDFVIHCMRQNPPMPPGGLIKFKCDIKFEEQSKKQQSQETEQPQETETTRIIDTRNTEALQNYFLGKAEAKDSIFAKAAMNDPVVGGFIRLVDPYRMRSHAPIACMVAYTIANLSNYKFEGLFTEARIVNIVARSNGGKDWILGTHEKSRSLYKQLGAIDSMSVDFNADAAVTGNGMSKSAFLWAAQTENNGKIRCMFWPEFGNAQTRGYGQSERAGSIGNYDMMIGYKKIKKPQNKADLKELKDYQNEYPYISVEIRAFQGINGAKVVIPQFAGSGEARRAFWYYMEKPEDDPLCNDMNAPDFERLLKDSAFMPDKCDEAFKSLKNNLLPLTPRRGNFDDDLPDKISIDSTSTEYNEAYQGLLKIVTNTFYRADKCELLRDKLQYCIALSAGMHGRTKAEAIDYQIGAYFTECLCDSLDKIMDVAGTVDDPESERSRIMQRVRANGIKGVYQNRLTDNTKLLDELCGMTKTKDGDSVFMPGAPLVRCYMAKKGKFYIAAEFVERAKKEHPKRNEIEFYK